MKLSLANLSAYQGRGWKPRSTSLVNELNSGTGLFADSRVNSEWNDLRAVLLYCPRAELKKIKRPQDVQHLFPIALPLLQRQFRTLKSTYRRLCESD